MLEKLQAHLLPKVQILLPQLEQVANRVQALLNFVRLQAKQIPNVWQAKHHLVLLKTLLLLLQSRYYQLRLLILVTTS